MTIEIINEIENPRWKEIPCKCNHDSVETEYPIAKCIHCESEAQEKMVPTEEYDITSEDDEGNLKTIHINKIKLQYNKKYENIIGYYSMGDIVG
jgi:hypothetical protein